MRVFFLLPLIASRVSAQSFEAASLRIQESGGNLRGNRGPQSEIQVTTGSLIAHGATLRSLVQWAWNLPPLAVSGPPEIDDGHYDVIARTAQPSGTDEIRVMMRHLLEERLSLQAHIEKKEKKVYALTVVPTGPKSQESTTEGPAEFTRSIVAGKTALVVRRGTMRELADALAKKLDELIVDQTGLKGRYDLSIDITPYAASPGDLNLSDNDVLTIMFSSLPAQTGLKLNSRRQPIELLVVDHIGPLKEN
jgi:uncharacterized protein (TIGR03435 family)